MCSDVNARLQRAIDILEKLVAFPSVSRRPNGDIIGYISAIMELNGLEYSLSSDEQHGLSNIYCTIGPKTDGGVVLSGHTDVVPVEGQDWATDPFQLTRKGDKLFGRGSVDMKGFLACALACIPDYCAMGLNQPIHIAFSYDEEIGGLGMPGLLDDMAVKDFRPEIIVVGEPTQMQIVSGHKGGYELYTEVTGLETHSSIPDNGVNAITYAVKVMAKIEEIAARFAANPYPGSAFVPPYATINIGLVKGGTATNATAGSCSFSWDFRPMPGEDGGVTLAELDDYCQNELVPQMRLIHDGAAIRTDIIAPVPALDDSNAAAAIALVKQLSGQNSENVVSFGTDAGYFSDAGYSAVVFGPGSIDRAHKPDEYITTGELADGLDFLIRLGQHLSRA